MTKIPTLPTARKAFERAQTTGDCADWQAAAETLWALLNKPKRPRRRRTKMVDPMPVMLTMFADGRMCRMTIAQYEGQPEPVERAINIARGIYRDHVSPIVPEVVSCEQVNGQPVPENCGLIRWQPSEYSLDMLTRWEQGDSLPEYWEKCLPDPVYDPWRNTSAPRYRQAA